jgi:DNA-binding NarL/FixJ family response regulator
VLVLTTSDLDDYVYEALRAGASGFLLKHAPAAELLHAVRVVAAGDACSLWTGPPDPTGSPR